MSVQIGYSSACIVLFKLDIHQLSEVEYESEHESKQNNTKRSSKRRFQKFHANLFQRQS